MQKYIPYRIVFNFAWQVREINEYSRYFLILVDNY